MMIVLIFFAVLVVSVHQVLHTPSFKLGSFFNIYNFIFAV